MILWKASIVTHYERDPVGRLKSGRDVRCLRCNAPAAKNPGLRSEALCMACAAGETIQ